PVHGWVLCRHALLRVNHGGAGSSISPNFSPFAPFSLRPLTLSFSSRVLKNPRSPFDKLRANGGRLEVVGDFPFVLSLSKHENAFFSSLLVAQPAAEKGRSEEHTSE